MPWGAGTYVKGVYNKEIPGTYINIKVNNSTYVNGSDRGYLACPIELPWGTDEDVIKVTAEEYPLNAFKIFGYNQGSPELTFVEEMLKNASTLYLYRLNGGGGKAKGALGTARCSGTLGNKISVVVEANPQLQDFYNVITYVDNVEVDNQVVPKVGEDTITLTKGTEKEGTAVETASATFDFADNKITVTFSNVPEGYRPSVRIRGKVGILAFTPGRLEDMELSGGNKHIITYSEGAPTNGEMTVEAVLTKDKATVLKSHTYTCQVNDDAIVGADATQLVDNDFVIFKKEKELFEENGGDTFKGGGSKVVNQASHQAAREIFENLDFNILAVPTTDLDEQNRYIQYVKDLRDDGCKFQIVLPAIARPQPINYEGVIEYVNRVDNPIVDEQTDLCYWLAGAEAGCKVQNSCTAKVYDGVFNVSAKVTRADQSKAINSGQILFHNVGDDAVILKDINTLTNISAEDIGSKSLDFANNQVIRVIDGISTETANVFNNYFLGKRPNNDTGRAELKNQLLKIREHYEQINAIEDYDSTELVVMQGQKLNEVIGQDGIRPLQAMDTLYFQITYQNV